jgi:hypothetical protein
MGYGAGAGLAGGSLSLMMAATRRRCPGRASLCSSDSRTASTTRICASRASAGLEGAYRNPAAARPARVNQHQPARPSRPVAASPARRHRATMPRSRSSRTPRAAASRSYGAPYIFPHSTSPDASRPVRRITPASDRRSAGATGH